MTKGADLLVAVEAPPASPRARFGPRDLLTHPRDSAESSSGGSSQHLLVEDERLLCWRFVHVDATCLGCFFGHSHYSRDFVSLLMLNRYVGGQPRISIACLLNAIETLRVFLLMISLLYTQTYVLSKMRILALI